MRCSPAWYPPSASYLRNYRYLRNNLTWAKLLMDVWVQRLAQAGVPVEQCKFVVIAKPYLGFALLALELGNRMKPDCRFLPRHGRSADNQRSFRQQAIWLRVACRLHWLAHDVSRALL